MRGEIFTPATIRALPVCPTRKVPVPWFVTWVDGKPEFRVADGRKHSLAIVRGLCWVCGQKLSNRVTFPIGPMCAINRVSAEPPSHPDCAVYSARACPFLSRPKMVRREGGLPEETTSTGIIIDRNPGVTCLWTTRSPGAQLIREGGGVLFRIFPPTAVAWMCEGREATREEVLASVESGLPILESMAEAEGPEATAELRQMVIAARRFWPTPAGSAVAS